MGRLNQRHILVAISGGISAYKGAELVRLLKKQGALVRVVLSRGATEFITPLTMQALSGQPAHTELLDEAAEALGATNGDRMAGTVGDLGVYSFNGNKIITTSGGGALVGDDPRLVERARFLSTQARDPSPINAYEHSTPGFNYRMSNLLAAVGSGQLRVLGERVAARRRIFETYRDGLEATGRIEWMPEAPHGTGTRWLTCGLVGDEGERDRLLGHLDSEGIEARPVWKPMHLQPLFAGRRYEPHAPGRDVSRELFDRGICLPSGSSLSEPDQARVIDSIRGFFR